MTTSPAPLTLPLDGPRALGWAVQLAAPGRYQATYILPADPLLGVTLTVVIEGQTLAEVEGAAELATRAMIDAGILGGIRPDS